MATKHRKKKSILHAAAATESKEAMRTLLSTVATEDIGACDSKGRTPLMLACRAGNTGAAMALIEHPEANATCADREAATALHYACATGPSQVGQVAAYTACLESLLRAAPKSAFLANARDRAPVHLASEKGNYTAVSVLIRVVPACLEVATPLAWRPLHFAVKANKPEIVSALLRAGADVNAVCTFDGSPGAPKFTPMQLAEHVKAKDCAMTLSRAPTQQGLSGDGSSRSIRRTQGAVDVKHGHLAGLPVSQVSPRYPSQRASLDLEISPARSRASAGYDLAPPVSAGVSEYDAVPVELRDLSTRSSAVRLQSSAAGNKDVSSANVPSANVPPVTSEPMNEYDAIPKELTNALPNNRGYEAVPEAETNTRLQPGYADPLSIEGDYSLPPPPRKLDEEESEYALAPAPQTYDDGESEYCEAPPELSNRCKPVSDRKPYDAPASLSRPMAQSDRAPVPQPAPRAQRRASALVRDPAESTDIRIALGSPTLAPHYHAKWSRSNAESFLEGKPSNTFVLRPTSHVGGVLSLSYVHPKTKTVQHSLIYQRKDGLTFGEEFGCPPNPSLLHLLRWQRLDI